MTNNKSTLPNSSLCITIQYENGKLYAKDTSGSELNCTIENKNELLSKCHQFISSCLGSDSQRSQTEILNEYEYLRTHDKLVPHPMFGPEGDRIWKNEKRMAQLEKEYNATLSEEPQTAILLYNMTSHPIYNWDDEKDGLIHNWNGPIHQEYLQKAKKIIALKK